MSQHKFHWGALAALSAVALLAACAQTPPGAATTNAPSVASNPPPVPPGPNAVWYSVSFANNSFTIDAKGQRVVDELSTFMRDNPSSIATIVGRTDTVGSKDYNMRLSHRRADAVRDALVYGDHVPADRVETRWTGEARQGVPTGDDVAAAANRVVDIAMH